MKAITLKNIESVATIEIDEPTIDEPSSAIVRVSMAGLCGSDLHPFFGRETGLDPDTVMGHEMVGQIVEVGSEVSAFSVGDRVFIPFWLWFAACLLTDKMQKTCAIYSYHGLQRWGKNVKK